MLAIRMQRTGRKGHAMFRVIVQESRLTPTSGKIVQLLGSYDPHGKAISLDKEKASFYLEHGARPSDRVARLLKSEGVKLPEWVELEGKKAGKLRNPEKLRKNQPKASNEVAQSTEAESEGGKKSADGDVIEAPEAPQTTEAPVAEEAPETPAEEVKTEEPAEETPAEVAEEAKIEEPAEPEAPAEPKK